MDIRLASQPDKQAVKEMWHYCFGDKDPFLSWYFDFIYAPQNTLVACEEGALLSSLQFVPYKISLNGVSVPISNVEGVSTLPEARNLGIMSRLITRSLAEMRDRGDLIALLIPFNYEFYRKYGWETCYYHLEYRISMDNLGSLAFNYGNLKQLKFPECIELLDSVYTIYNKDRNGFILRTPKVWEGVLQDHIFEGGYIYGLYGSNGSLSGYILYTISNGVFNIRELGYTDHTSAGGLWKFIRNHQAQTGTFLWRAPFDDISYMKLTDAREAVSVKPFVMARIIDVEKLLNQTLSDVGEVIELRILVKDAYAPWNNRAFRIKTPSSAAAVKCLEEENCADYDIKLSINTLTTLVMGLIDVKQAALSGAIDCKNLEAAEKLGAVFIRRNNYINDYF